eukprot:scaffold35414_cov222-Skeletonema_dohrnii-CCMP3373.AAC.2
MMYDFDFDTHHNQLRSVTRILIIGSVFDRFTTVIFEFILVVFLSSAHPDSLLLTSVYGLTNGLLLFFSGGPAGRFVDAGIANNRRLQSTLQLLT